MPNFNTIWERQIWSAVIVACEQSSQINELRDSFQLFAANYNDWIDL